MTWEGTKTFTKSDYYNYGDANRENQNVEYVLGELLKYGYSPQGLQPRKFNYTRIDFPKVTDINNIRANLVSFIQCSFKPIGPNISVNLLRKQSFGNVEANAIEQNLQGFHDGIGKMVEGFKYSGTFSCGQEIVL